jgi:hypothetical protein
MIIVNAGQIGPVEWILIGIGVLWLAGYLRKIIYVPIIIKESEPKEKEENETKIAENIKVTKPSKKADSGDYVPFEEIKD